VFKAWKVRLLDGLVRGILISLVFHRIPRHGVTLFVRASALMIVCKTILGVTGFFWFSGSSAVRLTCPL